MRAIKCKVETISVLSGRECPPYFSVYLNNASSPEEVLGWQLCSRKRSHKRWRSHIASYRNTNASRRRHFCGRQARRRWRYSPPDNLWVMPWNATHVRALFLKKRTSSLMLIFLFTIFWENVPNLRNPRLGFAAGECRCISIRLIQKSFHIHTSNMIYNDKSTLAIRLGFMFYYKARR